MKITQIITTYNRGELLRRSLDRLCSLTIPDELLVIDDGGTDDTEAVCQEFNGRLPIVYVYNHNPGPTICSMARNIGVKMARNEWLVTAEPELMFLTDALAQFEQLQPEWPNDIISAGKVFFGPPTYTPGEDVASYERAGDYTPPTGTQEAIGWVAPYTALWYKPWLMEVGGWDEEFPGSWGWDDIDLLTRLRINKHGQHINLGIEALHQFHGLGGDVNQINEEHFRAKSFQGGETDLTDLVANKEREWGILRTA